MKKKLIIAVALIATIAMVGCKATEKGSASAPDKAETDTVITETIENDETVSETETQPAETEETTETSVTEAVVNNGKADISKSAYADFYGSIVEIYNDEVNRRSLDTLTLLVKMGTVSFTYDFINGECIPDSEIQPLIANAGYTGDIADFTNAYSDDISYPSPYIHYYHITVEPNLASVLTSEFDADYYATKYPEDAAFCAKYDLSLERYYGVYGVFTGQSMSADFDLETYKANRPELVEAFGDCNINYYIYYLENIETEKPLANPNN